MEKVMAHVHKSTKSNALKEECRVNWKIANFSEIRDSKEALEAQIHRFEMGSSIKLPTKLKSYLTCKSVDGRMWINPVVALDEKPGDNVVPLFATLKVEVNEGSMFRGDTGPMSNIITDSVSYSPLIPQVGLPWEDIYVNADGSLNLSLIVNLYHFEHSSNPPNTTMWNLHRQFEQKQLQKFQQELSKIFQNPESFSQSSTMRKVVSSDNKEFFVNPDILQVRCPVLYSMLAEDTSPVLTLSDISGQHLETLLDFVHTSMVPFPGNWKKSEETRDELVYVATKFGLVDFVQFHEDCRQFSEEEF